MLEGVKSVSRPWLSPSIASVVRSAVLESVSRYHRHEVVVDSAPPSEPVLFVGNHGFGTVTDPNVLAVAAAMDALSRGRDQTYLVHDLAWTLKVGGLVAAFGGAPASADSAEQAWRQGNDVVVFPGGDREAGKSWRDRDRIIFGGRSGFARLAMEHSKPVVPVVTAGAGEGALVFTDGQGLASALGLDRALRYKVLPVSWSLPWGLSVGIAGLLPYLPLPTKLISAVMPAMTAGPDEDAAEFALRVESSMQARMDELVTNRLPLIG